MLKSSSFKKIMFNIYKKRKKLNILSSTHDEQHVTNVAKCAGLLAEGIAKKYNIDFKKAKTLAECAGYLHDIVREPQEIHPHGLEGAKWFMYGAGYEKIKSESWIVFPPKINVEKNDAEIIAYAIGSHRNKLIEIIKDSNFENEKTIKNIVAISIKIADALFEGSGYRVVERRVFFIGERIKSGDLHFLLQEYENNAPLYGLIGVSQLRLYNKNNLHDYPKKLQKIVLEQHAIQYKLYSCIMKCLGYKLNEEIKIANELLQKKFPKYNLELISKIKRNPHLTETLSKNPLIKKNIEEGMNSTKNMKEIIAKIMLKETIEEAKEVWNEKPNAFVKGINEYYLGNYNEIIIKVVKEI